MTRRIPIVSITQSSPGVPAEFTIGAMTDVAPTGDWRSVFQGKFFRQPLAPVYYFTPYGGPGTWAGTQTWLSVGSDTPPTGYELVTATQFDVIQNTSFGGRYTVYTATALLESSDYGAGETTIRVNEAVTGGAPGDLTGTGFITNVSTYLLVANGSAGVIVPPAADLTTFPVGFSGRNRSGWGEVNAQNHLSNLANFAGPAAPASPFTGTTWYDTANSLLKLWNGSSWVIPNASAFAPASSTKVAFTATGGPPNYVATIAHGLGAAGPEFLVNHNFFVDTGGSVYKPIIPQDVTYVDANNIQVTFSTGYSGFALVRL